MTGYDEEPKSSDYCI